MKEEFFRGYEDQISRLERQIAEQKVPHALLISGPDGNGLPGIALHLARALMCEDSSNPPPCGKCVHCRQILNLAHPDVFWIYPFAKNRDFQHSSEALSEFRNLFHKNPYFTLNDWSEILQADNKQLQIGVDDARRLIQHLSLTAMTGHWKVAILWGMEKMNTEAANALLKLLEEPDPHTKFICISHQPSELLPTIISRLQPLSFPTLEPKDVERRLKSFSLSASDDMLRNAAINSEGVVRRAQEWLEYSDSEHEFLEMFRNGMRAALKFHPETSREWTEQCASFSREKQKQFLEYSLQMIRKCLLMHLQSEDLCSMLPGEKVFLEKFFRYVSPESVPHWQQVMDDAILHIERNANPKILFTDLIFKFNELLHLKKTA